jgi:hypothetical protein
MMTGRAWMPVMPPLMRVRPATAASVLRVPNVMGSRSRTRSSLMLSVALTKRTLGTGVPQVVSLPIPM